MRIIGYHGTSKKNYESIRRNGFKISRNDYDWLGDGVYFFQDAPLHALEWAKKIFPYEDHVVVKACINLEDAIDLIDMEWSEILSDMYNKFVEFCKVNNIFLPRQSKGAHRVDREVINYTIKTLQDEGEIVKCVRAAFVEGDPIYPNSALYNLAHIQVVVRDLSLISGIEAWKIEV